MDILGTYNSNKAIVPKEYVDAGGGGGGAAIARIPLTYTVNSERLTDFEYTAYAYPTLGICFVRGSGTLAVDRSASSTGYTVANLGSAFSSYAPGKFVQTAIRCQKNFQVQFSESGNINIHFLEAGAVGDLIRFAGWWYTGVEGVSGTIKYTDLDTDLQAMLDSIANKVGEVSAGDGLTASITGGTLNIALDLDNYDGGAF